MYIIRNGVLKLAGQIRYQDRDLRVAIMKLMMVPQHQVCLDLSEIPSLCSPELQFVTKMAHQAKEHGKFFRVRLSSTLRSLFKDLELEGLVEIEEVDASMRTSGSWKSVRGPGIPDDIPEVKPPPPEKS
jgi:hypothetical protein